ncbi:heme exporter protein CcmD [Pseudohongiella acticola]|jgi:heme exporter protein CcmD|uniref:heme exporter protein CcmD n=1 Tax=Pseudohongiella acticola TaxID=1524254 RepID=UPI0030EBC927
MPTLQFSSVSEFIQMGAYSFHVWVVYLLFALFVGYNLLLPGLQRKQFVREQKRRAQRDAELTVQAARRKDSQSRSEG